MRKMLKVEEAIAAGLILLAGYYLFKAIMILPVT